MNKNTTLFGGIVLVARFEQASELEAAIVPQQIKVRQVPVREYDAGFACVDDEPALVGFLCGQKKEWALTLAPESFEEILITGREVNAKGFFSFCQRRMERNQERAAREQADMIGLMATLPAEKLKELTARGLEMQRQSRLPILSPEFVSPPVR